MFYLNLDYSNVLPKAGYLFFEIFVVNRTTSNSYWLLPCSPRVIHRNIARPIYLHHIDVETLLLYLFSCSIRNCVTATRNLSMFDSMSIVIFMKS